jgi:hypothetical protein
MKITDVGAALDPQFERVDTPRTDDQIGWDGSTMTLIRIDFARQLERELVAAQAEISAMRRWVNNNMTFYDVEPDGPDVCTSGPNIPTLCAVSKRIWYHATDNQTVSLFSEVIDAAMKEGK